MKNNLTEKDIKTINKWAEKYGIKELKINDEKNFNIKQLCIFDTNIKHIPAAIWWKIVVGGGCAYCRWKHESVSWRLSYRTVRCQCAV